MQKTGLNLGVKQLLGCLLVFILINTKLYSQATTSDTKEEVLLPDIEKIYVHTDRNYYTMGESLWYKVYSVYAYNNILFDNSKVLYVELIDPDSKIIARHKTMLEAGLGNGDFKLTDSVGVKKAGTYQLKAYTNWSRNFGDHFVFKKEIQILDVFNQISEKSEVSAKEKVNKKLDNDIEEVSKNNIKVQFFPEGGSLIENVSSIVAFKAIDINGFPLKIKGKVFNTNNELISLFASTHDGMGKFALKPVKGEQYHALITTTNTDDIEVLLPKANKQGYLLSHKKLKGKDIITVKTNKETLLKHQNKPVTIICTTRGVTYFQGTQPLPNTTFSFELPKANFPEGISQITLYDSNLKPQSERLIYVEKEHDFKVNLTTNKEIYKPEEKVTVTVSSKSRTGEVVPASFSLSSTDTNGVETKDYGMNICSYFLMQSDIKGKVHNPGYYFDDSNLNRLQDLDLLLLTQGWRDFLWKTIPKVKDSITYHKEKGITISGKVKQLFGNKPKVNSKISLTLINKNGLMDAIFANSLTDSLGQFKFENLVFKGQTNMLLNAKDKNGKNKGMFVLDSIQLPPMDVNFKDTGIVYTPESNTIKEEVYKKHVMFGVPVENILDEVEIIAKKKDDSPQSIYGNADNTYVIDEKTMHFNDLFQLIQFTIPGIMVRGGNIGFARFGGKPAYILIDGAEWSQADLRGINTDDVAKIEAFKGPSAAVFGLRGGNGVIIIYTKEGKISRKSMPLFHSIKQKVEGFYNARIFYSPDLENPSEEIDSSLTIRNTLYWNPYMHPGEAGTTKVTYYNSEVQTKIKVTLEGITATGIPVVKHAYYSVEE